LPKSKGARAAVVDAALKAAESAFTTRSQLPLSDHRSAPSGPLEGRRKLGGAYSIDIDRIRPDPSQPRKKLETEAQRELIASVKRLGILQPITVRYIESENFYQIITGERRFLAAKQAGLLEIPCWIQTPKDEDVLLHQIVENWQRLDMHPYDLADALARLRDANGLSQKEIAQATAKSEGEISKILSLLDIDPTIQKLARDDQTRRVTKRHLYAVRQLPPDRQEKLIGKIQSQGITADEAERIASKEKDRLEGRRRPGAPVSYHRFRTTQATVSLTFRRKEVQREEILAALEEVREQVTERRENAA
jgi:ParB family chromosome partitioning protein